MLEDTIHALRRLREELEPTQPIKGPLEACTPLRKPISVLCRECDGPAVTKCILDDHYRAVIYGDRDMILVGRLAA